MIATPTLGLIRYEWSRARYSQTIPVNWAAQGFDLNYAPLGYSIDDAYNLITRQALEIEVEWLITIEDDVILPPDCFLKFSHWIDRGDEPVVSGYYTTKSEPAEPLIFRGRGNGAFHDWTLGRHVTVDGLPMGCLLINCSILKAMWKESEPYELKNNGVVNRVFETPRRVSYDPQSGMQRQEGTQDLFFFDRVIEFDILKKTGWKKQARRRWPFMCDTSIFCGHIDRNTGKVYPA